MTYRDGIFAYKVIEVEVSGSVFWITPKAVGKDTITVIAQDQGTRTASDSFEVTVEERKNRPPELIKPFKDLTIKLQDGRRGVEAGPHFSDPDGDTLTYHPNSSNGGVIQAEASGSVVWLTPISVGSAVIGVTAKDPGGLYAYDVFRVTVSSQIIDPPPPPPDLRNRAPEAVGSIGELHFSLGRSLNFPVSQYFSDPDGDRLNYAAQSSDESRVTAVVRRPSQGIALFVFQRVGTVTVTITAADPDGLRVQQTTKVNVVPNDPGNRSPRTNGSIGDLTLRVGGAASELSMAPYFIDPNGDRLHYQAISTDRSIVTAVVTANTDTVVLTPVTPGTATVTITARDPSTARAEQTVDVTVNSP